MKQHLTTEEVKNLVEYISNYKTREFEDNKEEVMRDVAASLYDKAPIGMGFTETEDDKYVMEVSLNVYPKLQFVAKVAENEENLEAGKYFADTFDATVEELRTITFEDVMEMPHKLIEEYEAEQDVER